MDIPELFDPLLLGEHVEVVVASLPELLSIALESLCGRAFQAAHGCGQLLKLWFREEQMDVLGHDHVAEEEELMPLTDALDDLFEGDSGLVVVEIRQPVEATEGDEVVVTKCLVALQSARHEVIVSSTDRSPHPCYPTVLPPPVRGKAAHEWGTQIWVMGGPPAGGQLRAIRPLTRDKATCEWGTQSGGNYGWATRQLRTETWGTRTPAIWR